MTHHPQQDECRKTPGQLAYELDVERMPTYHDGTPRRTWDQLSEIARSSWEMPHGAGVQR